MANDATVADLARDFAKHSDLSLKNLDALKFTYGGKALRDQSQTLKSAGISSMSSVCVAGPPLLGGMLNDKEDGDF